MKFKEFTYTKEDKSVTQRAVIITSEPSKFISGYDVSGLSDTELAEFVLAYRELKEHQLEAELNLLANFDLKHSYRKFAPERMTNVCEEHI